MKTKLIANKVTLCFDEKNVFKKIPDFTPYWDYKSNNENISQTKKNKQKYRKNQINCDCIDESVKNGIRVPIPFTFIQCKLPA